MLKHFKIALIGGRGLLGQQLKGVFPHAALIKRGENDSNLLGRNYDLCFICAPSSLKWYANKNPQNDLNEVISLIKLANSMKSRRFILFSTIDAINDLTLSDEKGTRNYYGFHRKLVEDFVLQYETGSVVRLGALLGNFVKKNFLVDIKEQNLPYLPNPDSQFQFSNLFVFRELVKIICETEFKSLNYFSEPISIKSIYTQLGNDFPKLRFFNARNYVIRNVGNISCDNEQLKSFNYRHNAYEECLEKIQMYLEL